MAWYDEIVSTTKGNAKALANALIHPVDTATNFAKNSPAYRHREELAQALKGDFKPLDTAMTEWAKTITPEDAANFGLAIAPVGMFAGVKARGANLGNLQKAKDILANQGADTQAWKQTGWTHAMPDEMPRFEISDVTAKSIPMQANSIGEFSLSDVLHHPELYKNYPHLQNVTVKPGEQSSWNAAHNTITIDPDRYSVNTGLNPHYQHQENRVYKLADLLEKKGTWTPEKEARMNNMLDKINLTAGSKVGGMEDKYNFNLNPLLHEVQHAVQSYEGFGKGSNPEVQMTKMYSNMLNDIMEKNPNLSQFEAVSLLPPKSSLKQEAWQHYWDVPGEVEARLTQSRMPMTAEERLANYPIRYKD